MPRLTEYPAQEIILNDREQLQYLLGNPPSWMMRYGISVATALFLMLLALSYFVKYPDIIEAKVVLTTTNPPIRIMAKSGGRVADLLVTDKQLVTKNQVLAVLENTADWQEVLRLEAWLNESQEKTAILPTDMLLGELQNTFSIFSQHWKDMHYFSQHNGVTERIAYIQQQIKGLERIGRNLQKQHDTMNEEFALATKGFQRQQQLHLTEIISNKEFELSEVEYLSQKRQVESAEAAVLLNQMQIKQLEGQINDFQQGKQDNLNEKELALAEDQMRMSSAIAEWKNNFLITAPIAGQVSFSKIWSEQQPVNAGEEVLAIVPVSQESKSGGGIIGKAKVSTFSSGKIALGQRAIIRLDGYPAQQFGVLETSVASLSLLPQKEGADETYMLDLLLPDSLFTSYGTRIPLRQEMSGQVRVVTEDRRVISRIFDTLRDLLQH
jgi:multidrug resistance efflux pump